MTRRDNTTHYVNRSSGRIGFFGALTILFVALKITDVIAWSWFWVLSPMIFSFVIGMTILVIVMIVLYIIDRR